MGFDTKPISRYKSLNNFISPLENEGYIWISITHRINRWICDKNLIYSSIMWKPKIQNSWKFIFLRFNVFENKIQKEIVIAQRIIILTCYYHTFCLYIFTIPYFHRYYESINFVHLPSITHTNHYRPRICRFLSAIDANGRVHRSITMDLISRPVASSAVVR